MIKSTFVEQQQFVFTYRGRPYMFSWRKDNAPSVYCYGTYWEETKAKKLQHAKKLWYRNGDPYMARHAADFLRDVLGVKHVVWIERY